MNFYYFLSKLRQKFLLKNFEILYQRNKINPPSFVVWDSTKRCNLNCIHCGSQENRQRELNTKEVENILDQLASFGVRNFQITGGEPLLREDFIEVLNYADKITMKKVVTLEERFAYLAERYGSPEEEERKKVFNKYKEIEKEIFNKLGFPAEELAERVEKNG